MLVVNGDGGGGAAFSDLFGLGGGRVHVVASRLEELE